MRLLLAGPLRFTPVIEDRRKGYALEGAIALDRLIAGEAIFQHVVRPQRELWRVGGFRSRASRTC